jgi:sigma-B regulation protein RsbU (phosphoserine phosphatase)
MVLPPAAASHPNPARRPHEANGWSHALEAARHVQEHLFPRELPRPAGWAVAAAWRPARAVAGDYLDLWWLGDGHLALALGDVAGKGLGPALVMAGLRALVRSRLTHRARGLAGLARELNDYLLASTPDDLFVTLFLGVLDVATGRLRYVNAGHPPPVLVAGAADGEVTRCTTGGPVLVVLPGTGFEEGQVTLRPKSLLALFSDGITEATDRAGTMFHERRVVASVQGANGDSAARILAGLLEGLQHFTAGKEQADDISVILLRRPG